MIASEAVDWHGQTAFSISSPNRFPILHLPILLLKYACIGICKALFMSLMTIFNLIGGPYGYIPRSQHEAELRVIIRRWRRETFADGDL